VTEVIGTALWCLVAVYGIVTAKGVLMTALDRLIPVPVKPEPEPEIPDDLHALALTHSESWAQEETLRVARELYDTHKDWNRVRFAMGLGDRGTDG